MPDRLGPADDALRGRRRDRRPAARIFLRDADGRRPVYGGTAKFQTDPHWRDLILFYEYFHGDNGAGIGASHQTGWTGDVALLSILLSAIDPSVGVLDVDRATFLPRSSAATSTPSPPERRRS